MRGGNAGRAGFRRGVHENHRTLPKPPRIDADLLDVFHEEAVDILTEVEESLTLACQAWLIWQRCLISNAHYAHAQAARAWPCAVTMGNLAHGTETVLTHVEDHRLAPDEALFDLLDEIHDTFVAMLDALAHRKTTTDVRDLIARVADVARDGALPSETAVPARADDSGTEGGRGGQRREQLPKKKAPPKPAAGDGATPVTTPRMEEVEPRRRPHGCGR